MDKIKIKSIPLNKALVRKILKVLDEYGESRPLKETTFLGIADKLNLDLNKKGVYNKLMLHLFYMEQEGLIEERHFLKDCTVDYAIESPGIAMLRS